ncbi:hypothetical protein COOONC_08419 [Cooperia oncophora]
MALAFPDTDNRSTPWPIVDTPTIAETDFGSLSEGYGPPLFICFYNDVCGNNVSRIGDFYDVPLSEAVKALNAQPHYVHTNNLTRQIRFLSRRRPSGFLLLLLFRCKIGCDSSGWKRCALLMVDYKFAENIVENIEEEANSVFGLLKIWLERCWRYLRCLRIFAFVRLDFEFSCLVSNCSSLTHLSLSRFTCIVEHPVFNLIQSFEFNGCGMGYTDLDLALAKHLVKYFPFVKTVAFREVCFDPVVTSVIKHLAQTGKRYDFYQIISLQQFSTLVKSAFTVRPVKDNCVELVSERYGTRLFVYDNHRVFRTPS